MGALRGLRESRGLSQRALARGAGVAFRTVQLLESGRHDPRWSTLERLSRFLDVAPEELAGEAVGPTLRDCAARMASGGDWKGLFFEFVDDFRRKPSFDNDAVKRYFHAEPPREPVLDLSNLRVWTPSPDYLLAMKCVAARFDTHDREDVVFLLEYLGLKKPDEVFAVIERYYPRRAIPAKTRFFVEEILAG